MGKQTKTSIAVSFETKERMEAAKIHERETFDDMINRFLDLLPKLTNQKQLTTPTTTTTNNKKLTN